MDIAKIRKKAKDSALIAGETAEAGSPGPEEPRQPAPESETAAASARPEESPRPQVSEPEQGGGGAAAELLTFTLAGEVYAFRIDDIQEIIKPPRMTKIPRTEQHLIGIASLRGKIIPVIDLKKKLALSGGDEKRRQKVLVLKGPKGPIGALVDRVIGVIRPGLSEIGEAPAHLLEKETKFIEGVVLTGGKFVSIVKAAETLNI